MSDDEDIDAIVRSLTEGNQEVKISENVEGAKKKKKSSRKKGEAKQKKRKKEPVAKALRPEAGDIELPLEHVNPFSYVTYSWLDGFMWRAFRSGIDEKDVWKCPKVDGADANVQQLEDLWYDAYKRQGAEKASLSSVLLGFVRRRLLGASLLLILSLSLLILTVAYFLLSVLQHTLERDDLWKGLLFVLGYLLIDIIQNILFITVYTITAVAGARVRSGVLYLLYRKLIAMNGTGGRTTGQIVNLFANDSQRLFEGITYLPMLLAAPFVGIATTAYAIYLLGPWPLIGFVVLLLLFPLQGCIGKIMMKYRARSIVFTDKRVRWIKELLSYIKFVKMYGWENYFEDNIIGTRRDEHKMVEKTNVTTMYAFSVSTIVVSISTISTLMAYTLTGHDLSAPKAFTYLAVFSCIQGKLMLSMIAVKYFSEFQVATDRIQEVLMLADRPFTPTIQYDPLNPHESHFIIDCRKATLTWPKDSSAADDNENQLNDNHNLQDPEVELRRLMLASENERVPAENIALSKLTLRIEKGDVVGIAGSVGCGKTALIQALLGQLPIHSGSIAVRGKIAYVPQVPWIFNASLKDNILFGQPYNRERYESVLDACCLRMDLALLADWDETEIGERGVNLSGGQRQRVSLARAVYSDRDVCLLDDPFSAVDPDIAETLFKQVVHTALVGKTIIVVTHQAKFLRECDQIVYLRDGHVIESGSHEELLDARGTYFDFYRTVEEVDLQPRRQGGEGDDTYLELTQADRIRFERQLSRSSNKSQRSSVHGSARNSVKRQMSNMPVKQLILKEEQGKGAVKHATYRSYISAAGGVAALILVVFFFLLTEATRAFNIWWLAHWLRDGSGNTTIQVGNTTVLSQSMSDNPKLEFYNLVYGVSLLVALILMCIRSAIFVKLAVRACTVMHNKLLRAVLYSPLRFFESTPLGRILNRFSRDLDEIDSELPRLVHATLECVIAIVLYVVLICVLIYWFAIAVLPLSILFIFLYILFRGGNRDIQRLLNISTSPVLSHITATLQGLPCIHAYEKIDAFKDRFVEVLDQNTSRLLIYNSCMRWINLRLSFFTSFVVCIIALIIVLLPEQVPPATAGLAIVYALQLCSLFQFFVRMAIDTEAKFTSAERIDAYIKNLVPEESRKQQQNPAVGPWVTQGHIRFEKFRMRYRPVLPLILRGITCEIKQGEKIGIVGRTGSGKSSLAMALFRLVEAADGRIEIDGVDIIQKRLADLRSCLSIIPQEPVMFTGTIRSNLDPLGRSIDMEIWRALERVQMKSAVDQYEKKLETEVREDGLNFSLGERQLLCLARVILRHSKIVVLDEATAAIDDAIDAIIQNSIKEAFIDSTLLIIAHRLSTVTKLDRVMVMERGLIVEFDKPSVLLEDSNSKLCQLMALSTDASIAGSLSSLEDGDVWV